MINVNLLKQQHETFLKRHRTMVQQELDRAARTGEQFAKTHTGFKDQTGETRRKVEGKVMRTRGGHLVRLQHPTKVGRFMDQGTSAHPIMARRAPMLVFWWAKVGAWFVGKRVNHPGTKATHFVRRGFLRASEQAYQGIRRSMQSLAKRF